MIDSGTLLQGRFLIEDKIGMGGMGAVYRAIDQKFGSLVAIKRTFYGDAELQKAFEREARLLNGLHHPILPHVSDYFSENGDHFLVMEYIEGDDLSDLLKRGERFPVNTVLGWTLDLLDGLDYLHSQEPPVIHRDIKPHNMKLTSRGKIMLLDFGMAKVTSSNTLATKSVFGYSRRYSPFEQIEGTGTDERSDIFSLGASVYHLLTGEPPIDVLRRVSAIVAGKPDPLVEASSVNPDVPIAVSEILNTALALNAEHRFESARAMWNALEHSINTGTAQQNHETVPVIGSEAVAGVHEQLDPAFVDEDDTTPIAASAVVESAAQGGIKADLLTSGLGSQNLKRTLRRAIPASISRVRIKRPSTTTRRTRWLPILAACLAVALFAIYLGSRTGDTVGNKDQADTVATTPDLNSPTQIIEAPIGSPEVGEVVPDTAEAEGTRASRSDEPVVDRALDRPNVATRTSDTTTEAEKRVTPEAPAVTSDRRNDAKRTGPQRPRRVVKPAFEQPAVSSIEAIMTGVPYERRNRWADDRDVWTQEELRRRQIRRMMRENRRRQLPY